LIREQEPGDSEPWGFVTWFFVEMVENEREEAGVAMRFFA